MNLLLLALPRVALGLLLASGVSAAIAASAQPAQADVHVAIGIGYAPNYHWYNWRDNDGWHRRWVPISWAPPIAYAAPAYLYGPGYVQRGYWAREDDHRNWDRDRNRDRDRNWDGDRRRDGEWEHRDEH